MNKNSHEVPYEILFERYQESQREIQYLEYKVTSLYEEIEAWQKAYEDYADILMEHSLI